MLCYVISHVPGVLKGFQDQTVLLWIHSLCFDLAAEESIVGLWQGGPAEPSTLPARPTLAAAGAPGRAQKPRQPQPHLLCLFFWGQQTFLYQPDPADRCVCGTNPECKKITAAITVLFIWEAKSKIASDLGVRRDAKRGALCLDPQRV